MLNSKKNQLLTKSIFQFVLLSDRHISSVPEDFGCRPTNHSAGYSCRVSTQSVRVRRVADDRSILKKTEYSVCFFTLNPLSNNHLFKAQKIDPQIKR